MLLPDEAVGLGNKVAQGYTRAGVKVKMLYMPEGSVADSRQVHALKHVRDCYAASTACQAPGSLEREGLVANLNGDDVCHGRGSPGVLADFACKM